MRMCRSLWVAISHSGFGVCLVAFALSVHVLNAGTLPKGTKFVEYIESSGTQWINTGFSPSNANVRIEVAYRFVKLPTGTNRKYVFGSSFAVNNTNIRLQYAVGSAGNCFIGFGNTYKNDQTFDSYDTNTVHTIVCDGGVFSLDGETSADWDLSSTTFAQTDSAHPVYLFGHNVNNSGNPSSYLSSIRLYSCKIWDQGELIRNFIPAVTNDTISCLYDKVAERFYLNVGSGDFAAGAVVPMEYRNLAYIESARSAYINTGYVPNAKTEIEMKYAFASLVPDRKTYVFGVYGADGKGRFMFSYGPTGLGCFLGYGNKYQSDVQGIPYNTSQHIVKYVPGNGFLFDGDLITTASVDLTTWSGTSTSLYLGWTNPNDDWKSRNTDLLSPIRIYACKISENGTLVHDWVPKQRKFDGKNGLYDNVTGDFLAYYGSLTDFTAGYLPCGLVVFVR